MLSKFTDYITDNTVVKKTSVDRNMNSLKKYVAKNEDLLVNQYVFTIAGVDASKKLGIRQIPTGFLVDVATGRIVYITDNKLERTSLSDMFKILSNTDELSAEQLAAIEDILD